jgi:CRP/FNR family transcriptional regulator, cyclic AMP receptor protein
MANAAVYHQLLKHSFVAGLSPAWLRGLARYGELIDRPAGSRLFTEEDPAGAFWLIRSGLVALDLPGPDAGRVRLEMVGPDRVLGWSWLVPPYRFTAGAVVVEPMRAVEVRACGARRLLASDPELRAEFLVRCVAVLSDRLSAARRRQAAAAGGGNLTKVPYATAHRP